MNATTKATSKPTLLDSARVDLATGILPRVPVFPASNYTYAKRCERLRELAQQRDLEAVEGMTAAVAGSNTYAKVTRAYGAILQEFLRNEAQLEAAILAAEAQMALAEDAVMQAEAAKPQKAPVKKAPAKKPAAKEAA